MHMRHLALTVFLLAFVGCASTTRVAETVKVTTQTEQGVVEGKAIDVIRRTEETEREKSDSKTQVDVEPIVKATVAAVSGNLAGTLQPLIAAMSAPKDTGNLDGAVGALGGIASGLGGLWLKEFLARRAKEQEIAAKQREVDEEYQRANANHDRAEQYARQLPPEASKS